MTNRQDFDLEIERNYKHNFIVNFLDGTTFWFGASFFAYRTILPAYISKLTDSEFALALLSMLLATGWLLPQLFTANWVQRLPLKKIGPVNIGLWTERFPIFLLAAAAWLATISRELSLVVSLFLIAWHIIGAGVIAVAWQDMLAKIFPLNRRGRFFGVTNFGGTATGVLGASTVAWLLDHSEFPYGYIWSFSVGAILVLVSWFYVVFFLTGVGNAGFMLSGIMIIFEFCLPEIRPTYIGLNNTFNGLVAIILPFIGGWIATVYSYQTMFWVAFTVCSVGLVLLHYRVQEPRKLNRHMINRPE